MARGHLLQLGVRLVLAHVVQLAGQPKLVVAGGEPPKSQGRAGMWVSGRFGRRANGSLGTGQPAQRRRQLWRARWACYGFQALRPGLRVCRRAYGPPAHQAISPQGFLAPSATLRVLQGTACTEAEECGAWRALPYCPVHHPCPARQLQPCTVTAAPPQPVPHTCSRRRRRCAPGPGIP